MKRVSVRVTAPCFMQGEDRRPGQIFMVDEDLFNDPARRPSCVQRVTAERPIEHELAKEEYAEADAS